MGPSAASSSAGLPTVSEGLLAFQVMKQWRAGPLGGLCVLLLFLCTIGAVDARGKGRPPVEEEAASAISRAKASIEARRFQDAVATLKRVLEVEPENAEAHVQLGRAQANLGHLDVAEELYLKALHFDARHAPAMTALGKLYLYQKKTAEAREFFERAIAVDPKDADALLGLGRLEVKAAAEEPAAMQRAESYLRRSLDVTPKNEQALFDYGVVLSHMGRHEDAARSFSAAAVLNPTLNFTLLGQLYQSFEQWPRAADSYRSALQRDPADVPALFGYAQVQEVLGNRREALVKYHRLLEVDADHAHGHARLGLLLTGTGVVNYGAQQACGLNRDEAMWHLNQAVKLDPSIRQANDSLEFCLREEIEERRWAERVAALKAAYPEVLQSGRSKKKGPSSEPHRPASSSSRRKRSADQQQQPATQGGPLTQVEARVRGLVRWVRSVLLGHHGEAAGQGEQEVWVNGKAMRALPVVTVETAEQLMDYVKQSRPVVIKNFQDAFASRDQWTRQALKKRFGHMPVRVSVSQTGRFDGPEDGVLWGLGPGEEVLVRPPSMSMRFTDFVDLLQLAADPRTADSLQETFYLEYLSLAQYLGPELLDMLPLPKPAEQSGMDHLLTNFWMGKGNTTSPLHYDDYENLLCQVVGTKELVLFPPPDIKYLYYTGRAKGVLEYEYPGQFRRGRLADSKYAVVFGSSVFMDEPDLTRHPLLVHATPYKVVLSEGDVLYLPSFWHHEVQSKPDAAESLNIAVNYWFKNETSFLEEDEGLQAAARAQQRRRPPRAAAAAATEL